MPRKKRGDEEAEQTPLQIPGPVGEQLDQRTAGATARAQQAAGPPPASPM